MKPKRLYKHTIVIWSGNDDRQLDIVDVAKAATNGDSFCSWHNAEIITDTTKYPAITFFDLPDPEPYYPKPWKMGFRPIEGATVYAKNDVIVPWEMVTEEMNKKEETYDYAAKPKDGIGWGHQYQKEAVDGWKRDSLRHIGRDESDRPNYSFDAERPDNMRIDLDK